MSKEKIFDVDILDESKQCFLDYAKEVLEDRAIPSAEDGLLRVHREIIWTMEEILKMNKKSNHKKSASIVGTTLSTAYFHGDASCYGAMCKLSLPFLMRYPLVDGKGTLGTQESNDMQPASRYTNARPSVYADLMMNDYKKNVVGVKPTYNNEYFEPVVLPSLFPNAICNGRQGIGVSMAHNSMPHNLTEVCDAIVDYIEKDGNVTVDDIMKYIKGPDFPLGGVIINEKDIREAYETGRSTVSLKIRGDYIVEDDKIIFTSIPYRIYRESIRAQINKNIDELSLYIEDFNDESGVGKNKLIFTLIDKEKVEEALECIFKNTDLQTTCSFNMNFIVNGTPKLCSMKDLISNYVEHQNKVLIRSCTFDKDKAEKRAHILKGLLIALKDIGKVIELIRGSNDKKSAREILISYLKIDEIQANAILDMKLSRLTKLDEKELFTELEEKLAIIKECKKIIEEKDYRNLILIKKIQSMKKECGDARRTKLENLVIKKPNKAKKEIPNTPVKVCLTRTGNGAIRVVKRTANGLNLDTTLDSTIVIFSNKGKAYKVPVQKVGEGTQNLKALLGLEANEIILNVVDIKSEGVIYQTTKNGMIKKTNMKEFTSARTVQSIKLKEKDEVVAVAHSKEPLKYLQQKTELYCLNINIESIPITGRAGIGLKGIKLHENDYVKNAVFTNKEPEIIGKRGQVGQKIDKNYIFI